MNHARLLETHGFNQLAKGSTGYCLYNIHDRYIGKSIEKYGEYAGLEVRFLAELCRAGDVVIDLGANIGVHTVALAHRVGPAGGVLAFEPQRLVFQSLCANVALNSLANVECHWAAADAEPGLVFVPELDFSHANNFGGVSLLGLRQGRQVPAVTLDQFLHLPRLRLIKIDVEGMESAAIRGGVKLIEKFKPFLYVENDRVENSQPLMRSIDALGYDMYWHATPLFNPGNFYGEAQDIYKNLASFNLFCVHREAQANILGMERITDFASHPLG
jgi:FkbM family methyltransferase